MLAGLVYGLRVKTIKNNRDFVDGMNYYLKKDFLNAAKKFLEAQKLYPEDETPKVFVERCKKLHKTGVPESWDGVINMTTK